MDGKLLYSKKQTGAFPDEDALLAEMARLTGKSAGKSG